MRTSNRYDRIRELLKEARRNAGITQDQLADMLNRPKTFPSKVEKGERILNTSEFMDYCEILGVRPSKIIAAVERAPRRKPASGG